MVRVWYSNQLEILAGRLIENLRESGSDSTIRLFQMPRIVVPNRNIESYLKYEIARVAGIAAGLVFQVPEQFLENLLCPGTEEVPQRKLLHGGALRAFFLDVLSEPPGSAETRPLPEPVRDYLDAAGDDRQALDRRRFQLAARLARLAQHYADARPALLRTWSAGGPGFSNGLGTASEVWQRALWERLLAALHRAEAERGSAWVLPWESLRRIDGTVLTPTADVHFFGFSYFTPAQFELLDQLDRQSALNIYTFTPCDWNQVDPQGSAARRPAGRTRTGRAASQREELSIVEPWGAPGRDCADRLAQFAGVAIETQLAASQEPTVLGRLQREILGRAPERPDPFQPDSSLLLLGCPGIRREAEIIANEIWRLVQEDDSKPDGRSPARLRFCDIAVLLADSVERAAYQAHFRAVFEELHGIPYNMVDLPLPGECQVIEAMLLLLALPLGEFTRPELLKILGHRAVRARFGDADPERWRRWCLELEMVRGADRSDHEGTYIDRDLFHWEQGLRRLVVGVFMTGPFHGDERGFPLEGSDYVPHEVPPDAWADAARLLLFVRSLVADARFARQAELTLTEWSEFFLRLVGAYLGADTDPEQRALSLCLRAIHDLRRLDVSGRRVGYVVACESLREALYGLSGARGHYLVDGVVVAPLKEMRALPFRVIFVCGLGEGRFPSAEGPDPLDLTAEARAAGDVRPRERDKYLFLETLTCARERLYLSYISRDLQTDEELNAAPVVAELMRYLRWNHDAEPFKSWLKQPLRRFDDLYFASEEARRPGAPAATSFSAQARKEWQARRLRRSLDEAGKGLPCFSVQSLRRLDSSLADWLGLCPLGGGMPAAGAAGAPRITLALSDLRRFLECPLQGWARVMLRLHEDDEDDEAAREDEPFASGRLRETMLLRAVFLEALQDHLAGHDGRALEAIYNQRAEAYAERGWMPVGLFGEAESRRHRAGLLAWEEQARTNNLVGHEFRIYRFGSARESERVDRLEPAIALDVSVPAASGETRTVRVDLVGRTEIVAPRLAISVIPVLRPEASNKDFLRGFMDALALSLVPGEHEPGEHHTHVLVAPRSEKLAVRTFRDIDAARARRFLTDLVADLLGGPHDYLLPCEAVFDFLNPRKHKSLAEVIEALKEDDRSSYSSHYGPVPNLADYEPPDEALARQIIERRFGLFRDSGGMEQ
jgi:exodeoxyribonuclease V gamma subunit